MCVNSYYTVQVLKFRISQNEENVLTIEDSDHGTVDLSISWKKPALYSDYLMVRKFNIVALQEVQRHTYRGGDTVYQSSGSTHELITDFILIGVMEKQMLG